MKGIVLLAGGAAAAIALGVSAAGAAPDGSALPVARTAGAPAHQTISGARIGAKPRSLAGVPATGSYAFLLTLGAEPTMRAYYSSLSRGRSAARAAATRQLATVDAAENRVVAALPSGSHRSE